MQTLVKHASVKRFHLSDQLIHFLNLICWAALSASGFALASAARAGIRPERLDVSVHFFAGFALIIVIAAWLVFSPGRARRFVHEILRTDRPFLAWFRNLGGYPAKVLRALHLTKTEPATAPQGRYNAGQRIAYALLVLLNLTLIGTGVLLFILHQPHEQTALYQTVLAAHSIAFEAGVLILLAHIPMGLLSLAQLKAILPGSNGRIPAETAAKHAPLWFREDLEPHAGDPDLLVERRL